MNADGREWNPKALQETLPGWAPLAEEATHFRLPEREHPGFPGY